VRESDELWQLATAIRDAGPATAERALALDWAAFSVAQDGPARAIADRVRAFLHGHRHRGANYKDVVHPRWGDDPELLWRQLRPLIEAPGERPRDANEKAAQTRVAAETRTRAALTGWRGLYRRPLFDWLLRNNAIYASLRDNHRFYYDNVWWLVRLGYREKGRRLAERGRLGQADDVFYLGTAEIAQLFDGTLDPALAAERIASRRREWAETLREQPPRFLKGGYAPYADQTAAASGDVLTGIPASPGLVEGRARIAYDITDLAKLQPGDILVTRQTDPAWTPAFARLAGLVLETGGALAHGASLCREFGLPCVTAVERAAAIIKDGDTLLLSGAEGAVRILKRADGADRTAA
jgi:pyruvate,water dikinase